MAKKQFLKLRRLAEDQDITTDELAAKAGMTLTPMAREMESTPARSFSALFCFILKFLLSCPVWFLAAQSPRRRMRVMTFALTALHCTGPKSRLSSACVRQSPRIKTLSSGTA